MTDVIIRETEEEMDNYGAQAQAAYQVWAERGRKLETLHNKLDLLNVQLAALEARNIELERTNGQLNERISESMSREATALSEASRLKGIMQVSGIALSDGMNRDKAYPRIVKPST